MTKRELQKRLERIVATFKALNATWDQFGDLTGAAPASPLGNAVWAVQQLWIEAESEIIGDDDDWLNWFIWDNDCGAKGYEARAEKWKIMRKISTAKDLANLIWDSRQ